MGNGPICSFTTSFDDRGRVPVAGSVENANCLVGALIDFSDCTSHRAEARRAVARQLAARKPRSLRVVAQGRDDPVELAGLAQFAHLAQAQEDPVLHLGALADGLHQREVAVRLVAPTHRRGLHVHAG